MNNRKIKNLLREIEESLMNEVAYTTFDLNEGTGIFIVTNNSGATLTLYNPKLKIVYGTITFTSHITQGRWHNVSGVASKKGYGALMYELAFMYVDSINSKLMPSRDGDVKERAFNVWIKMYDRDDIDKTFIDIKDGNFRFDIITGVRTYTTEVERIKLFDGSSEEEKQKLKVFNTAYNKTPSKEYNELVNTANNYSEKIHDEAEKMGDKLWQKLYKY